MTVIPGNHDAYVKADIISVANDISGIVAEVDVKEGQALLAIAAEKLLNRLPAGHVLRLRQTLISARLALAAGHVAEARQGMLQVLKQGDGSIDQRPVRQATLDLLARADLQAGEPSAALSHAQQAVALAREAAQGFEASAFLGQYLLTLGLAQQAQGQPDTARLSWQQAQAQIGPTMADSAQAALELRRLLAAAPR